MNAAELFVRCLEREGVRYVFGVPGEENQELLLALADSKITFVPTRHEQGAAFIADVWGRVTGTAGVCLSTLGPGATNLLTGVASANLDKSPLVAITAQGDLARMHHESHQAIDAVDLFRPITKWNDSIAAPSTVAESVRKAFKIAEAEKPGACHLELPENVARAEIADGIRVLPPRTVRRPAPDPRAIADAARLLAAAERPLVLAGNGAIRHRASRQLHSLCDAFDWPVAHTFMGKGAISDRRAQSLMTIGQGFRDYVAEAVERCDLFLTVGYDIAEYDPEAWNPGGAKPVVHLDFAPAEVYASYQPTVEVIGDLGASLEALEQGLRAAECGWEAEWYKPIRRRIHQDVADYQLEARAPFSVPGVLSRLRAHLGEDGLLISDVGTHKMWIARNFPTYCPNGCLISNGFASMGIALPGGIAAALAEPERTIVVGTGDGGFLMNVQELETARRLGVAFTILVFRDDDYGLISWKQERETGRSAGTRIGNPDLVALAQSFGLEACRPSTAEELDAALEQALRGLRLTLIDIPIDTHVNDQLLRKLARYWKERPQP